MASRNGRNGVTASNIKKSSQWSLQQNKPKSCQPNVCVPIWSTKTENGRVFFESLRLVVWRSSPSGRATQSVEVLHYASKKAFQCYTCPFFTVLLTLMKEQYVMLNIRGFPCWLCHRTVRDADWAVLALMVKDGTEVMACFQMGSSFWLVSVDRELCCYSHSLYFIFPTLAVTWEILCLLASVGWLLLFCFVLHVSWLPSCVRLRALLDVTPVSGHVFV